MAKKVTLFYVYYSESESEVAQSCPTLRDPMDCSLSDSSVHGIFQARVLEWVAISFSRGSSQPRDQTRISCIAGRRFTVWATREALSLLTKHQMFMVFWGESVGVNVSVIPIAESTD